MACQPVSASDTFVVQAGVLRQGMAMDATTFVVCGFHQGRKLKPVRFSDEARAREHAAHMGRSLDCVVLTTSLDVRKPQDVVRDSPPMPYAAMA